MKIKNEKKKQIWTPFVPNFGGGSSAASPLKYGT